MNRMKYLFIGGAVLVHLMIINAAVLPMDYYKDKFHYDPKDNTSIRNSISSSLESLRNKFGNGIGNNGNGSGLSSIFNGNSGNGSGLSGIFNGNSGNGSGLSGIFNGLRGKLSGSNNASTNANNNANKNAGSTVNSGSRTSTSSSGSSGGHDPVLFIHGMNSIASVFNMHINYLVSQGWDRNSLYSVDLPDKIAFGSVNAEVISKAADDLLQRTGKQKLDIVCHSMGGANTMNYILNAGGASKVKKVITLGGANRLVTSNAPSGIEVITISSSSDAIVNPSLSKLNGANNIVISGVSHTGLLSSSKVQNLLKQNL